MSADRYVVLGLAHVRSTWFTEVARWATVGSLPLEFVKCVSAEQLRARLAGGQPFSAALVDARLTTVDRDLLATIAHRGTSVLVVEQAGSPTDWVALGAAAVLDAPLEREGLLDALTAHCSPIDPLDGGAHLTTAPDLADAGWRSPMIAVVGRGGAGTSTIAAALSQGLAADPRHGTDVVLADLARHAHQALLHDARDVVPGLQDLVEAHRSGRPSTADIRGLTFEVPDRGYRLLLGLRSPHDWLALRSAAFTAALAGLRRSTRFLVTDCDDDLEGEADTGSLDIEDRNLAARHATSQADLVIVVARPNATGLFDLVRLLADLDAHGVDPGRTLVAINHAPRRPRLRAELARTVAELCSSSGSGPGHAGLVFVPERRAIDDLHRDLAVLPNALVVPITAAAGAALDRVGTRTAADLQDPCSAVPVAPGSLGSWPDADDEN